MSNVSDRSLAHFFQADKMKRIFVEDIGCFISFKYEGNEIVEVCSKEEWAVYLLEVKLSEEYKVPDDLIKEFVEKARELEFWENYRICRED